MLVKPSAPEKTASSEILAKTSDGGFSNCAEMDFTDLRNHQRIGDVCSKVRSSFPIEVPSYVNGTKRFNEEKMIRCSPNNTEVQISIVSSTTSEQLKTAVKAANDVYFEWRDRPIAERAEYLNKLGDLLEKDRFQLSAIQMYEVGKPWAEADADVAEAVDFCRYYARQAMTELAALPINAVPGEANTLLYKGRGPTAVISPWNFPVAILCGMTTAALVAGNPVLIKPAGNASATAYFVYEKMLEAGIPPKVVQFLPGRGDVVGEGLVRHPFVSQIAFTGSKEVGLSIYRKAGEIGPEQTQIKHVVFELGGKNAIIVDDNADLDEAVMGVLKSAFGYAGQKCSACSRVILVGEAYNTFVKRLIQAVKTLPLSPADHVGCRLGPVIDQTAYDRLMHTIKNPGEGVKTHFIGEALDEGYFVPPTIFEVDDVHHPLMQQELFGPIVTLFRATDFSHALKIGAATEFALTCGIYTRKPSHLEMAKEQIFVGNLYLNRGCTGAIVNSQPFRGFKMSGGGTKAGGPGYLMNFVNPYCITENTMRRGFSPETSNA